MSIDFSLGQWIDYGGRAKVWHEVFDCNFTHNMIPLWSAIGCYEALYNRAGAKACHILPDISAAVEKMRADPDGLRKFDVPNKWGTYNDALPWLIKLESALQEYPLAEIMVSK